MGLKPMNCPAHVQLYKDERRSYRDLPIRYSEKGLVHRHEPSGTLHGLLRVRHITQDDAHIFCTEEQVPEEVQRCLDFGYAIYDTFGFEPRLELSTRPEKRVGAEEMWDKAEARPGEGAGRQGPRVRAQPGRRRVLRPEDRPPHDRLDRPLVAARHGAARLLHAGPVRARVHRRRQRRAPAGDDPPRPHGQLRALHGDPDRALRRRVPALAGAGPGDRAAAGRPARRLRARGARRVDRGRPARRLDERTESVGRKIREAELRKVPYMLVVGDREAEQRAAALRRHREGDLGTVPLDEVVERLVSEASSRE